MRVAAPDQQQHQHEDEQNCDEFRDPQGPAAQLAYQHVHANMPAIALSVGNSHEGDQRHGLFDPIDISGQRTVEEIPSANRDHRQDHQRENRKSGDKRKYAFDPVKPPV